MDSVMSVSQVRERLDSALTSAGYTRSRHVPELYGRDTDHLLPRSYSISTPVTVLEDFDGRERFGDEGEAGRRPASRRPGGKRWAAR